MDEVAYGGISLGDAARILGVSEDLVLFWVKSGRIRGAFQSWDGTWRFAPGAVEYHRRREIIRLARQRVRRPHQEEAAREAVRWVLRDDPKVRQRIISDDSRQPASSSLPGDEPSAPL